MSSTSYPDPPSDDRSEKPENRAEDSPPPFDPDLDWLEEDRPSAESSSGDATWPHHPTEPEETGFDAISAWPEATDEALVLDSDEPDERPAPDDASLTGGAGSSGTDEALLLDAPDSGEIEGRDEALLLDDEGVSRSDLSDEALLLDDEDRSATAASGESLLLDDPAEGAEGDRPSELDAADQRPRKRPIRAIAAVAALAVAAVAIPPTSIYVMKQREIDRIAASEKEQRDANQREIDRIAASEKEQRDANQRLQEANRILQAKADLPGPTGSGTTGAGPSATDPIKDATRLTLEPSRSSDGMIQIARYASDSDKDDSTALYSYLDNLSDELKDPAKVDRLLAACQMALQGMRDKDPKLFSRLKEIEARFLEAKESLRDGVKQDTKPDATVPGRSPGSARRESPGRPRTSPRRILRAAFQPPPAAADAPRLSDSTRAYLEATRSDPENIRALAGLARAYLADGRRERRSGRIENARKLLDEAFKTFQQARGRLGDPPVKRDPKGLIARDLLVSLEGITQEQQSLPVSSVDPDERKRLNGELKTANADRDDARGRLADTIKERDEARSKSASAIAERDEARSKSASAIAERDEARSNLTTVTRERDEVRSRSSTAIAERDEARSKSSTAIAERDEARSKSSTAIAERDEARRGLSIAIAERDEARKRPGVYGSNQSVIAEAFPRGREATRTDQSGRNPEPPIVARDGSASRTSAWDAYFTAQALYGEGDYMGAGAKFTEAINAYPNDARFYYFRALCRYHLGGGPEFAKLESLDDIRTAIALENDDQPTSREVGRALINVQGPARNWLESFRSPGRFAAMLQGAIPSPGAGLPPRLQ